MLFKNEYKKFIIRLRKLYSEAKLFIAYGVMDTELISVIEELVKEYKKQSGDKHIAFVELEKQKAVEGIGADGHPSIAVNKRVADSIVKAIIENIQ